ncbi:hypothetical protein [Catellatospora sp. NPDC049609]|uniref:hypothetical protein n=1 Tax=Catellatospora sp. NPDC049609 TaxID=3155505 RepID=UPI00341D0F2D
MDNGEPRDALRRALGWLAHPVSVAGLVLLLVNDHLLKAWQPGWVTGKLSDVAGMLMFPPLLAVVIALVAPRVPGRGLALGALAATGAGFALVKTSAYGAQLASQAWSVVNGPSVVRADLTDLLALPALGLGWWAWRRTGSRPAPGRAVARLVRGAVLVPVALLATAATSAAIPPPETVLLVEDGVDVYLGIDFDGTRSWAVSVDDGLSWTAYEPDPSDPPLPESPRQDCAGQVCYRVVPGALHVESSQDGGLTWRTAWEIRGRQHQALVDEYDGGLLSEPVGSLWSFGLVVRETETGHVVLVANGRDGLLRRDAEGVWTRLGTWSDREWDAPPPLAEVWTPDAAQRTRATAYTIGVVVLFVLMAGLIAATAGRRTVPLPVLVLSGLAAWAAATAGTLAATSTGPAVGAWITVTALGSGALAACALLLLAVKAARARLLPRWRLAVLLLVGGVAAAVAGWTRALVLDDGVVLRDAALDRLAAALLVTVVALIAGGLAVAAVRLNPPRPGSEWRPPAAPGE